MKYIWPAKFKEVSVLFLLILVSLILAIGFLLAFIWSVNDGQFDDDYTPSVRILFDTEPSDSNPASSNTITQEDL